MFKLEAQDFTFHIPWGNFPNFSLKILVLYSARILRSFYFSLLFSAGRDYEEVQSCLHFTSNKALLKCKGHLLGKVIPVFVYLWNWDKSVKLDPNNPNHGQQFTESHQKC